MDAATISAANQTRAARADGQSKPNEGARASRGAIVQLVIDTGAGTLTPVSGDYELTEGMIWTCGVFLLPLEMLHNLPASEAVQKIRDGLGYSHGYEAPRTIAFLNAFLADCEANPRAIVSVIEAA